MQAYVLSTYPEIIRGNYPKVIKEALQDINNGVAYKMEFAQLICGTVIKEINALISAATKSSKSKSDAELLKLYKLTKEIQRMLKKYESPIDYKW